MGITLRAEKGSDLTPTEADANFNFLHGGPVALTISSDTITVTGTGWYTVDTQGAAATDDLSTILGTTVGDVVQLRIANASRVVTVKHNGTTIFLANGLDFTMDSIYDSIMLRSYGSNVLVEMPGGRVSIP